MADHFKMVEHYVSTQGEGPNTGRTTQFVRFAGCDMRCGGWPCDTPFASDPKQWAKIYYKKTVEELYQDIIAKYEETGAKNICFTGGEPFMQDNDLLDELFEMLDPDWKWSENEDGNLTLVNPSELKFNIEAFSNGSFLYSNVALEYVEFMMDWKLDGSGEGLTSLENRLRNAKKLMFGGIKFVCKDEADFHQAIEIWNELKDVVDPSVRFWVGSASDVFPTSKLVEMVLSHKLPWSLNVQVHNYIWPANERGR